MHVKSDRRIGQDIFTLSTPCLVRHSRSFQNEELFPKCHSTLIFSQGGSELPASGLLNKENTKLQIVPLSSFNYKLRTFL